MKNWITATVMLGTLNLYGAERKTIEPSDIANIKAVSGVRISPDGKLAAYVVNTPVDAGKHKDAHIWLTSTDGAGGARPFVYSDGTDGSPEWSPNGEILAFLSDRKNPLTEGETGPFKFTYPDDRDKAAIVDQTSKDHDQPGMQLWMISLHGGEAWPLSSIPGGIKTFRWSKDGKWIAFIRTDQDTKQERERKEKKNDEVRADSDYKFDRLWLYDVDRHEAHLLTRGAVNIDDFDWSPDGTRIAARVSPTPRIDDYWRVSKVVILDAKSGEIAQTVTEHSGYMRPRWSPDAKRIAFSRFTERQITDQHVVLDLNSGKELSLEGKNIGTIYDAVWAPDSKSLLIETFQGSLSVVVKSDVVSGDSEPMKGFDAAAEGITLSDDGLTAAFLGQTPSHPDDVWVYRDGHSLELADSNPQVKDWNFGTERPISWKSTMDGRTVYGVVDLPPNYDSSKRYKTVVHVHGGPEEAWFVGWHGNWYNYAVMLASHGYVVLLPDPRGSDGQGPAFTEANYRDWGYGDFQDIMDGADKLVHDGISDPDRMVIGGWSFGGFMTAWTVTHTHRFKAAMVGAGVTDLYSMATTTDIAPSFSASYFGPLATSAKYYDEHSPVRYLNQCQTPVLVLHGEDDVRVPLSQGQEFYSGLKFLGRETVMVKYPREPHIFTERGHQIDSLQRILGWYDSHVEAQ